MATIVQSVCGGIGVDALGVTLMHEHLFVDWRSAWPEEKRRGRTDLRNSPVTIELLGDLRVDPYAVADNQVLQSLEQCIAGLERFKAHGGQTIVDPTGIWPGRQPKWQRRVAETVGVNVIAATGFYLGPTHPKSVATDDLEDIARLFTREVTDGIEDTGIRAGIIGEIGISTEFTEAEEKVLRAAARAQRMARVPLMVHLPSRGKYGEKVLNIVEEEGGSVGATILCHLNWDVDDVRYQLQLLRRGAYIEFDMLGMDFYYPEDGEQAPCDRENVRAIEWLVREGYGGQLLLASDVFLKIMLREYGGNGYEYVLRHFVPRLERSGIGEEDIVAMLVKNVAEVFTRAGGRE